MGPMNLVPYAGPTQFRRKASAQNRRVPRLIRHPAGTPKQAGEAEAHVRKSMAVSERAEISPSRSSGFKPGPANSSVLKAVFRLLNSAEVESVSSQAHPTTEFAATVIEEVGQQTAVQPAEPNPPDRWG